MSQTKSVLFVSVAIFITALAILAFSSSQRVGASAFPGGAATVASSSLAIVPINSAVVLIATSSCAARIISTASTTLMLTFNDAQTPTGLFGVWQAASTTVAYDGGQYGCGQVKAFSNASGLVTVIDAR